MVLVARQGASKFVGRGCGPAFALRHQTEVVMRFAVAGIQGHGLLQSLPGAFPIGCQYEFGAEVGVGVRQLRIDFHRLAKIFNRLTGLTAARRQHAQLAPGPSQTPVERQSLTKGLLCRVKPTPFQTVMRERVRRGFFGFQPQLFDGS